MKDCNQLGQFMYQVCQNAHKRSGLSHALKLVLEEASPKCSEHLFFQLALVNMSSWFMSRLDKENITPKMQLALVELNPTAFQTALGVSATASSRKEMYRKVKFKLSNPALRIYYEKIKKDKTKNREFREFLYDILQLEKETGSLRIGKVQ